MGNPISLSFPWVLTSTPVLLRGDLWCITGGFHEDLEGSYKCIAGWQAVRPVDKTGWGAMVVCPATGWYPHMFTEDRDALYLRGEGTQATPS